jgi:hypothetical protein
MVPARNIFVKLLSSATSAGRSSCGLNMYVAASLVALGPHDVNPASAAISMIPSNDFFMMIYFLQK